MNGERKLIPTTDACKISGFGRQYIEKLLRAKRIEGIKPGHDWLIYEDSLVAFLAQPRKKGPKGPRQKNTVNGSDYVDQDKDGPDANS